MAVKKYSMGFIFDKNKENVLLIRKTKPSEQKGFLNGIGGKLDDDDDLTFNDPLLRCFIREVKEETNLDIDYNNNVHNFGVMRYKDVWEVQLYYTICQDIDRAYSTTEEIVGIYNIEKEWYHIVKNSLPNVPSLIQWCSGQIVPDSYLTIEYNNHVDDGEV